MWRLVRGALCGGCAERPLAALVLVIIAVAAVVVVAVVVLIVVMEVRQL